MEFRSLDVLPLFRVSLLPFILQCRNLLFPLRGYSTVLLVQATSLSPPSHPSQRSTAPTLAHSTLPLTQKMLLNLALFALAGVSALANSHTDHSFESHHGLARLGLALEAVEPAAPSNSNAKERRRAVVELEERAVSNPKAARGANYYSALVAIGASYTGTPYFSPFSPLPSQKADLSFSAASRQRSLPLLHLRR